jgi:hypothetical protein
MQTAACLQAGGPGRRGLLPLQKRHDLVVLGKAPDLVLREDVPAIDLDVEDAVVALDELGFDVELVKNRGRQTGGLG